MTTTPAIVWADRIATATEMLDSNLVYATAIYAITPDPHDPYADELRVDRYRAALRMADAYADYIARATDAHADALAHERAGSA